MEKKVFNKTTFTQKVERGFSRAQVSWVCRKGGFNITIERNFLSWYILAERKKDSATWNSLWNNQQWKDLEEAMEFASNFDEKNITNISY
jgi:hypothetical protein